MFLPKEDNRTVAATKCKSPNKDLLFKTFRSEQLLFNCLIKYLLFIKEGKRHPFYKYLSLHDLHKVINIHEFNWCSRKTKHIHTIHTK